MTILPPYRSRSGLGLESLHRRPGRSAAAWRRSRRALPAATPCCSCWLCKGCDNPTMRAAGPWSLRLPLRTASAFKMLPLAVPKRLTLLQECVSVCQPGCVRRVNCQCHCQCNCQCQRLHATSASLSGPETCQWHCTAPGPLPVALRPFHGPAGGLAIPCQCQWYRFTGKFRKNCVTFLLHSCVCQQPQAIAIASASASGRRFAASLRVRLLVLRLNQ
jgi:hypothetical protein